MENEENKTNSSKRYRITFIICVLLLCATIISVFKLSDFINKPNTLFKATVDEVFDDFNKTMTTINNNRLYTIIDKNKVNIDTNLNVEYKTKTESNKELEEKIKDVSFKMNTQFDKKLNYMISSLSLTKKEEPLTTINYIKNNNLYYLKIDKVLDKYIELDNSSIDFSQINANENILFGDIVKGSFSDIIKDERFQKSEKVLYVNNKKFDCNVSAYTFNGKEIQTLLEDIKQRIKDNKNTLSYLSKLYNINEKDFLSKLDNKIKDLNLSEKDQITFSSYTEKSNDQIISFVIETNTDKLFKKFTYSKASGYSLIDYQSKTDTFTVEVKTKNDKEIIKYQDTVNTIILEVKSILNKYKGTVTIIDSKTRESKVNGNFNYEVNNKINSINLDLSLNLYTDSFNDNYVVNSKSVITKTDEIKKMDVKDFDKKTSLTGEDLDKLYKKTLDIIKKS